MKMKGVLAAILTAVLCISGSLFAYSGGNGSAGTPFQIANVTDFQQFSATPTDWSKSFILTANINLAGLTFTQAAIAPDTDTGDEEFDFIGTPFTGIFDGNGHVVSNLTITEPQKDFISLFGAVGSGGQVKNLGMENVDIMGRSLAGGLVGHNEGAITGCHVTGSVSGDTMVGGLIAYNASGLLTSCYVTGSVSSNYGVGGLVGTNWGTLTGCYASGSVIGGGCAGGLVGENHDSTLTSCYVTGSVIATSSYAGGLVGLSSNSTLSYCYATGSVTGTGFVGGLVGENDSGAITSSITSCYATGSVTGTGDGVGGLVGINSSCTLSSCYATGSVNGNGDSVGGLVGWNNSTITSCYATGNASGTTYVGGLLGYNNYYGSLANCYATGSASGTGYCVGGLVGFNDYGTIINCYSTGQVIGNGYIAGLVGVNNLGTITACFWDTQTSGQPLVGIGYGGTTGATGKTTVEMKTLSTFTDEGWDFSTTDGDAADWWMPANSYPRLAWPIIGDIAGSYGVNLIDFAVFAAHWEQTGCPAGCGNADINNSGTVDISDLTLFADNWLKGI